MDKKLFFGIFAVALFFVSCVNQENYRPPNALNLEHFEPVIPDSTIYIKSKNDQFYLQEKRISSKGIDSLFKEIKIKNTPTKRIGVAYQPSKETKNETVVFILERGMMNNVEIVLSIGEE